jgi:hypothetical protein
MTLSLALLHQVHASVVVPSHKNSRVHHGHPVPEMLCLRHPIVTVKPSVSCEPFFSSPKLPPFFPDDVLALHRLLYHVHSFTGKPHVLCPLSEVVAAIYAATSPSRGHAHRDDLGAAPSRVDKHQLSTKPGRQSTKGYAQGSRLLADRCASHERDGDTEEHAGLPRFRPPCGRNTLRPALLCYCCFEQCITS